LKNFDTQSFVFRFQLFANALIQALLIFQFEPMMTGRGVPTSLTLQSFSISQILVMVTSFFIAKYANKMNKNMFIRWSLIIRVGLAVSMFFVPVQLNPVFIVLFIAYLILSTANPLLEGMIAQWAFGKRISFTNLRIFASIGFALSSLVATFIFDLTEDLNYLIVLVFVFVLLTLLGNLKHPLGAEKEQKEEQKEEEVKNEVAKPTFTKKMLFLLFLAGFSMALPQSFGVIMNSHYRDAFELSLEQAMFYGGIGLMLGSFVSEIVAFFQVEKLISLISAKHVILLGFIMSFSRWIISFLSPNPMVFTISFLFHGFNFVFLYMGALSYIRSKASNEHTSRAVMIFSLCFNIANFLLTQTFAIVLEFVNTTTILLGYVVVGILITWMYYFVFRKD